MFTEMENKDAKLKKLKHIRTSIKILRIYKKYTKLLTSFHNKLKISISR